MRPATTRTEDRWTEGDEHEEDGGARDGGGSGGRLRVRRGSGVAAERRLEYLEGGDAEDMAEVISLNGAALNDAVSTPYDSFGDDVLVTKDWNPLEPDILERKYYAPGIGLISETKVTGPSEKVELIDFKK